MVGEVEGEYSYEAKKHMLNWRLALIDSSARQGSMEFSMAGMPGDFFPIKVSFVSSKPYCKVEVSVLQGVRGAWLGGSPVVGGVWRRGCQRGVWFGGCGRKL